MPICAAMPMLWPEGVLDRPDDLSWVDADNNWYALRVQPRCEKAVVRVLLRREEPYFVCMRSTAHVYQRRRVISQTPLFPGYVFAAAADHEALSALWHCRHVSCVLKPPSQAEFLEELRTLYRLVTSGAPVTPEEQLQPGQQARITRGCLAGVEGTVVQNRGGMRLIISVSLLGQGASVEVTPDMVEKVS
jgi:transcription antitermination factor NusG